LPTPVAFFIGVCEPVSCTRIPLSLYLDFDLRPVPEQNDITIHANIDWRIEFHHCVLEDASGYGPQVLVFREYCSERRNELEVLGVYPPGCLDIGLE
jgi:hypothetical protein